MSLSSADGFSFDDVADLVYAQLQHETGTDEVRQGARGLVIRASRITDQTWGIVVRWQGTLQLHEHTRFEIAIGEISMRSTCDYTPRVCPACGCTDRAGCLGGCAWTPTGVCTRCVPRDPPGRSPAQGDDPPPSGTGGTGHPGPRPGEVGP